MTIVHDTRDQAGKHKNVDDYLLKAGHKIVRSKMYVGDVTRLDNQTVCIDLKRNLQEVCGNLTQQHERFVRECVRAKDAGIKLVILVEHGCGIKTLQDVDGWVNPRLKVSPYAVSGQRLRKMMETVAMKYGVVWMFCSRSETGEKVVNILCQSNLLWEACSMGSVVFLLPVKSMV